MPLSRGESISGRLGFSLRPSRVFVEPESEFKMGIPVSQLPGRFGRLAGVFSLYLTISVLCLGIRILPHPTLNCVGVSASASTDWSPFIWAMVWWPYAIAHRLNPFITQALWAPVGFDLAWGTFVPGLSLLAFPITHYFGPVAAYNFLSLLAPAVDAFAAFLVCRLACTRLWPALTGGYIFGFSPYVVGHFLAGHLVLTFVPWAPLAVYVSVLYVKELLRPGIFLTLLTVIGVAQFLTSTEIFATTTVMAFLLLVLVLLLAPEHLRATFVRLAGYIFVACVFVGILMGPYIYYVLVRPESFAYIGKLYFLYVSSIRGLFVPCPNLFLSHHEWTAIAHHSFGVLAGHGNFFETSFYLGPLLVLPLIAVTRGFWHAWIGKLLLCTIALFWILSLGPYLPVPGFFLPLPWWIFWKLPLIQKALPGRLCMYAYLSFGIFAARLIDEIQLQWLSVATAVLAVLVLLPDVPYTDAAISAVNTPAFFLNGDYKNALSRDDIVLMLPFCLHGNSMIWQAESGMYFRMAAAWTGPLPEKFADEHAYELFGKDGLTPLSTERVRSFISKFKVTDVIIPQNEQPAELTRILGREPAAIDGVFFYRLR